MKGNSSDSLKFLKLWEPDGPWHLTAIAPDRKGIQTKTFTNPKDALHFIDHWNGERNLYFTVNRINRHLDKKAEKTDISEAQWLHVDIDPDKSVRVEDMADEQERLLSVLTDRRPKGIPEPTCIIFSGGGFQGFWKLNKPILIDGKVENAEEFELYNKRLEQVFGGDHCHNVDRIMRLPGTINVPDAKKRKRGRVEVEAKLLQFDKKAIYKEEDFKRAAAVQTSGPQRNGAEYGAHVRVPGNVERVMDLSELDEWNVPDRVKIIVAQGHHPEQPKEGDNSRSAWLFDCVCGLVRCGVPDEIVYSLITDPEWLISSSVIELKGGMDRYAVRQITRAKEYCEDPKLNMMNDRHAVIGNIGGKCRVIEEIDDEVLRRSRITMASFQDLQNRYSNQMVSVGTGKDGSDVLIPLGKYWLGHPMRRQYDTMKFMPQGDKPGVYNLWRGFAVSPVPGECEKYLEHIKQNVCSGSEVHFEYLIKWMANAVQNPASPGQVAIVLRGGKGTGKSVFATIFGRLFGRHFLHVSNPSHLVGNFNAHLRDVICLFADEAFFAGDKRHESVLKTLVTEESIQIEAKGYDAETYPNYVHLIMASNDPHVIRATGDERRYFVLDMGETKKQNKKYFADMYTQMENGGYEALLYYLQTIDLTDWQVRDVPETDALQEQKLLSMGIDEEWWYRKLQAGRLLETSPDWNKGVVAAEALTTDFTKYADKWNFSRRGNETALGRFLSRVVPHLDKAQKRVNEEVMGEDGHPKRIAYRAYFYYFGDLEECRAAWDAIYGDRVWPEPLQLDMDQPGEVPF